MTTTGTGGVTVTNSGLLDIAPAGDMNLDGAFLQQGGGTVQTAGDIVTTGDTVEFTNAVTLTDSAAPVLIDTTNSGGNPAGAAVTFDSTVDATTAGDEDLTINAGTGGDVTFTGAVGGTTRLGILTITNANNVTASSSVTAASIRQVAGQGTTTFDGAVNTNTAAGIDLNGNNFSINNTVTTTGTGGVTVTNSGLLDIATAGNMTLDGAFLQDGNGNVQTAADITTTADNITFTGPVAITDDQSITLNSAGGNITFINTLDGEGIDYTENLTLTAGSGSIDFQAAVGSNVKLGQVIITSAQDVTTDVNGFSVGTLEQQAGTGTTTFNGPVSINNTGVGAGTGLAITTNNIAVNSTVTTANSGGVTFTNAGLLNIASTGDMTLDGAFLQNGAGSVSTAGDITTNSQPISFATGVTLTGSPVLLATDGSNSANTGSTISLASTLNMGGNNLNIHPGTSGSTTFTGQVSNGGTITFTSATGAINPVTFANTVAANLVTVGGDYTVNTQQLFTGNITTGGGADKLNISNGVKGNIDTGAGNDILTFTGGATSGDITGGAGDDLFNFNGGSVAGTLTGGTDINTYTFNGNGTVTSAVTIQGDDIWNHAAGLSLGNSIVGADTTSLRVPNTSGGNMIVDSTDLALPDITQYNGNLILGGSLVDTSQTPNVPGKTATNNILNANTSVDINTDTLLINSPSPFTTSGDITLIGREVKIDTDINPGTGYQLTVLSINDGTQFTDDQGNPTTGGEFVTLNPHTITATNGVFILTNTFVDSATNLTLNIDQLQTVIGPNQTTPQFVSLVGNSITPTTDTQNFVNNGNINVSALTITNANLAGTNFNLSATGTLAKQAVLAGNLIGLQQLAFIDVSLFEQDLDLFGTIGQGIALALEQCEELEGCAVNEDELNMFIDGLKARIAELERRQKDPKYAKDKDKIKQLLAGYNEQLDKFGGYLKQLQAYNAASQAEEEGGDQFDQALGGTTIEGQIKNLSQVLELAKQRIDSLQKLKANADERAKLSKSTGIELTIEALDEIIKATNREIQFIESQIKQLQDSNQAGLQQPNGSLFWAVSGDQRQARQIQFGPAMFNKDDQVLAVQASATGESWY